ncbi:MAG TPA: SUMF1/EgtB/PvdO family nonheme iron enzyme [Polyangiaceae bacterium]
MTVSLLHACEGGGEGRPPLAPALHETPPTPPADEPSEGDDPAPPAPALTARIPSPPAPPDAGSACPGDMVIVDGLYCPKPKQVCKRWVDPPTSRYADFRCAEYAQPSICLSPSRVHERFCIDREEYVRPGDELPLANQSWTGASKICASLGKRLCLESEWQLACEGEEMRPYPYGFVRDASLCNIDQAHLGRPQEGLRDLRAPTSAYPQCLSPYGVHDMSGNVEEWATLDHGAPPDRSTMKGAWWLPGKNNCRAATLGHGEIYLGPQVGVRCCREAE